MGFQASLDNRLWSYKGATVDGFSGGVIISGSTAEGDVATLQNPRIIGVHAGRIGAPADANRFGVAISPKDARKANYHPS